MSLVPLGRRSRRLAVGVAAALATGLALAANPIAGPANAANPAGSLVELFVESPTFTANPTNAIASGWWGHEGGTGPAGAGPSILSLAGVDGSGQITQASQDALLAALGTDNFDDIGYAVVPYTANGSNERPAITPGENAAEAFQWVVRGASGWGASLNGSAAANDSVTKVSTLAQLTAWVNATRPLQGFDNNLVLHDLADPANPVSVAPEGKSILNAWPAGTQLSLVAYVTTGAGDPDLQNEVPLVEADGTGHAKTAWMPFTTVASPTSALRTSAGYSLIGAYAPGITRTQAYTSTGATLTGTVKNNLNATATDATGNLEFAEVVGGVRGTATAQATVNGVAALSIPGFTSGTKVYDVRYVPDGAASATYSTTDWFRTTMTAPTATVTKLTVTGGTTSDTIKAVITPHVAGTVKFIDATSSSTTSVTKTVSTSTGVASWVKPLSAKKHTIKATFTPSSAAYQTSTATKVVWKPSISVSYSDSTPAKGTTPKMAVKVVAVGTTVSGTITITWDPPSGTTKYLKYTLVNGAKTVVLPKMVLGTTRITLKYSGNSTVLAATKATLLKAH